MSNDKKTQRCMCVTIDFEQLTFGELRKFVELTAKYTNNNVQLKAFHSAVLGSDEKQLQAVQSGTQEFYIGTLAPFSARVKEVQVWDLPFMFANTKEVYALLDGSSCKKIFEKLEPIGVHGLMWTGMGFRNLSNSKHPVNKLEDINGLKVRVMANPVALETWKTLGANAVPMAFSEVFTALEIKAIDGQENPLVHMYSNKMQEVQKYISLSNHVYTPVALVVSEKFWKGLSDADKAAFKEAAKIALVANRKKVNDDEANGIDVMKKAGTEVITTVDNAAFQKAVASAYATYNKEFGEANIKKIMDVK